MSKTWKLLSDEIELDDVHEISRLLGVEHYRDANGNDDFHMVWRLAQREVGLASECQASKQVRGAAGVTFCR